MEREIEVSVNGERQRTPPGTSVEDLLRGLSLTGRRLAVELNREILPRSRYGTRVLENGDRIEIVHAIGGG